MTDVWEIVPASDSSTQSVTFPDTSIAYGYKTSYVYDTLNNLTTVNQGAQTRSFAYSSLSRLLTAQNPESGTIHYGYDPNGNLTSKTDARSITTSYAYDALNRVTQRTYSDSTLPVYYTYDNLSHAKGKLTKVTTGAGSTPFSITEYTEFDAVGRVKKSRQTTDGTAYNEMEYTYNLSGALVDEKYPSGRVVRNVLDNDGDLSMVQSKRNANHGYWNYARHFTYTAAGAVASMQLGNGAWEKTAFNSRLQPTQIALGKVQSTTDLLKLDYTYGVVENNQLNTTKNNGNIQSQTITVPTVGSSNGFTAVQTYTYDSLNRIDDATEMVTPAGSSTATQSWKQDYTFDRYGNRNFDEANTTTIPKNCSSGAAVCPADRKVFNPSIAASTNRINLDQDGDSVNDYAFDASGNTTKDANGRTFVYDAENKQIEVKNASNETIGQYWFDGDGRRVRKRGWINGQWEETIFVYDASSRLVAEYSTTLNPTPQVAYLTNDHLGTPRIDTNENGTVISRHDYRPYGEEVTERTHAQYVGDPIRKQFTGYERDKETDLDFAQARMYGNSYGRFTSPDPTLLSVNANNPQSWNRYVYVMNNPLNYADPLGLWRIEAVVYWKMNEDGTYATDNKGRRIVDHVTVWAFATKEDDDGNTLAKQLGLAGDQAKAFAETVGDSGSLALSNLSSYGASDIVKEVSEFFSFVEEKLQKQVQWMEDNPQKAAKALAKGKLLGPSDNDCSGTSCRLGLRENINRIGTNILDPKLDDRENVGEASLRLRDIVRWGDKNNTATHFANFIFRNDDGSVQVFSKSGENGPYHMPLITAPELRGYGSVRGRSGDITGYYRAKHW